MIFDTGILPIIEKPRKHPARVDEVDCRPEEAGKGHGIEKDRLAKAHQSDARSIMGFF